MTIKLDRTRILNASDLRFVKIGATLEIWEYDCHGRTGTEWHKVVAVTEDRHIGTERTSDGVICVHCPATMFEDPMRVINMML